MDTGTQIDQLALEKKTQNELNEGGLTGVDPTLSVVEALSVRSRVLDRDALTAAL